MEAFQDSYRYPRSFAVIFVLGIYHSAAITGLLLIISQEHLEQAKERHALVFPKPTISYIILSVMAYAAGCAKTATHPSH